MKLSDLKQNRKEVVDQIEAVRNLMKDENRVLTDEEVSNVEELSRKLTNLDASIKLVENEEEEVQRKVTIDNNQNNEEKVKSNLQLVRHLSGNSGIQDEVITDHNKSVGDVITSGLLVSRATLYSYASNGDDLSPTNVADKVVVTEVEPDLWKKMGVTTYEDLKGGSQKLPFMNPITGESVAEEAGITRIQEATDNVELAPARIGTYIHVTREALAGFSEKTWASLMANAMKNIDRKIIAKIYEQAFAGATTVTDADDITKSSFDKLEAAVPVNGAYLMPRNTFFEAKSVAIDSGSGRFLVSKTMQDEGVTYEGTPVYYSQLFADAAKTKYVLYGSMENVAVGFWGDDAYEVIVDYQSKAEEGVIRIVISKIVDIKVVDAAKAFAVTPDLDPTS